MLVMNFESNICFHRFPSEFIPYTRMTSIDMNNSGFRTEVCIKEI
jgi:hypothetical protein